MSKQHMLYSHCACLNSTKDDADYGSTSTLFGTIIGAYSQLFIHNVYNKILHFTKNHILFFQTNVT